MKLTNAAPSLATLVFALTFSLNITAQYRPNVVIWGEAPECQEKKSVNEQAKFACSAEDGSVRTIDTDEIKLRIQPHALPGKISIRTIIENKTDKAIKTSHKEWSIAHYASEHDFLSKKSPVVNERYLTVPTPVVYPSSGGMSSPSDPTLRRVTTAGSTSSPGYPTQLPAGQQQVMAGPPPETRSHSPGSPSRRMSSKQQVVLSGEFNTMKLTENTIKKQGMVNGAVVFNTYENAKFRLLLIHIGDTTFIFALRD
ncbi:MAG: hypothetical protein ABL984_13320 [Pyrinomonadaceae bacterium]